MAITHSKLTVGSSAVSLTADVPDRQTKHDRAILVSNPGTDPVYVGDSSVTTTNYGYALVGGGELMLDLDPGDEPYAVSAGSVTVYILHMGV